MVLRSPSRSLNLFSFNLEEAKNERFNCDGTVGIPRAHLLKIRISLWKTERR